MAMFNNRQQRQPGENRRTIPGEEVGDEGNERIQPGVHRIGGISPRAQPTSRSSGGTLDNLLSGIEKTVLSGLNNITKFPVNAVRWSYDSYLGGPITDVVFALYTANEFKKLSAAGLAPSNSDELIYLAAGLEVALDFIGRNEGKLNNRQKRILEHSLNIVRIGQATGGIAAFGYGVFIDDNIRGAVRGAAEYISALIPIPETAQIAQEINYMLPPTGQSGLPYFALGITGLKMAHQERGYKPQ